MSDWNDWVVLLFHFPLTFQCLTWDKLLSNRAYWQFGNLLRLPHIVSNIFCPPKRAHNTLALLHLPRSLCGGNVYFLPAHNRICSYQNLGLPLYIRACLKCFGFRLIWVKFENWTLLISRRVSTSAIDLKWNSNYLVQQQTAAMHRRCCLHLKIQCTEWWQTSV